MQYSITDELTHYEYPLGFDDHGIAQISYQYLYDEVLEEQKLRGL